jgi:hypothetical protein
VYEGKNMKVVKIRIRIDAEKVYDIALNFRSSDRLGYVHHLDLPCLQVFLEHQ